MYKGLQWSFIAQVYSITLEPMRQMIYQCVSDGEPYRLIVPLKLPAGEANTNKTWFLKVNESLSLNLKN